MKAYFMKNRIEATEVEITAVFNRYDTNRDCVVNINEVTLFHNK